MGLFRVVSINRLLAAQGEIATDIGDNGIAFGLCPGQRGVLTTVECQCSTGIDRCIGGVLAVTFFKTAAFLHTGIDIPANTVRARSNADTDGAAFALILAVHGLGVHGAEQVYVLCRRQGGVFTGGELAALHGDVAAVRAVAIGIECQVVACTEVAAGGGFLFGGGDRF